MEPGERAGIGSGTPPEEHPGPAVPRELADYESLPLTRSEYIAAMVHLYRGELGRADAWRMRLDNTTNWAVLTTAALLSMSFGTREPSHWILLMGLPLISVFLGFEARRFRFEDVWRTRVRKIEENFYGPILRRDPVSPEANWGNLVAEDLFRPRFKIGRLMALRVRFLRNYWAIYLVLVFSWVVKILIHPVPIHSWSDLRVHLGTGVLPWWLPLAYLGGFLSLVLALLLATPSWSTSQLEYWTKKRGAL